MSLSAIPAPFNAAINAAALVFAWFNASVAVAAVACTPTLNDAVSGLTLTLPSPVTVIDLTIDPAAGAGSGEATDVFGSPRPIHPVVPTATMPITAPPTTAPIQRVFMNVGRLSLRVRFPGKLERMNLPLSPPLSPMLSKAAAEIPTGEGWHYEPKWDGFRCIVFRDGEHIELASRNERPFTRYFPELLAPLLTSLPQRCVVDGEIVVPAGDDRGLDFDA